MQSLVCLYWFFLHVYSVPVHPPCIPCTGSSSMYTLYRFILHVYPVPVHPPCVPCTGSSSEVFGAEWCTAPYQYCHQLMLSGIYNFRQLWLLCCTKYFPNKFTYFAFSYVTNSTIAFQGPCSSLYNCCCYGELTFPWLRFEVISPRFDTPFIHNYVRFTHTQSSKQ